MAIKEFLLVVENTASDATDVEVLPNELVVDKQATIGKLDDALIVRHLHNIENIQVSAGQHWIANANSPITRQVFGGEA